MSREPILITGVGKRVGLHLAQTFEARGTPVIGTFRSERAGVEALRRQGVKLHYWDFDDEDYREKALSKSLMRREGDLEAIQHGIDNLLGSGYVTGRMLPIDGGRHLR